MNSNKFKDLFKKRWFLHLLFWIFMVLLVFIRTLDEIYAEEYDRLRIILTGEAVKFISLFFLIYYNLLNLIPRYFNKEKYFTYFITVFSALLISALFQFAIFYAYPEHTIPWKKFYNDAYKIFFFSFFPNFAFLLMTTLLHFLRDWIRLKDVEIQLREAEKDKLEAELKALKAQINPHFLFNSLNNIYSLSLDNSSKSPELLLKLSGLMRYILYDCNDDWVRLEKELEFVQNYIDLERIRVEEHMPIHFKIEGQVDNQLIRPLMFIPFIENTFKHGLSTNDPEAKIDIQIQVKDSGEILFQSQNGIEETEFTKPDKYSGVGIENVKRRLDLLYPDKHELRVNNSNGVYEVFMKLEV